MHLKSNSHLVFFLISFNTIVVTGEEAFHLVVVKQILQSYFIYTSIYATPRSLTKAFLDQLLYSLVIIVFETTLPFVDSQA